jgi:hypothetical protein
MNNRVAAADWLAERISGSRRAARRESCQRCGALTWRGDDDDRCSLVAVVDAEPVSALVEVIALLKGRASYDLTARAGAVQLQHRDIEQVRAIARYPIHLSHQCE